MRIDKLRENPHWSYSAMQCYLTCPLKYKFRYIDNAEPERTGSCFIFGKAFHAALSERARIGRDMSEREVCDVFEDFFKVESTKLSQWFVKALSQNCTQKVPQCKGVTVIQRPRKAVSSTVPLPVRNRSVIC